MIACPRCGRVDDGSSYQCPACFTVLQPDLANARKRQQRTDSAQRTDAAPRTDTAPPPASHPPPIAALPPGPTPENPYQAPAAVHQPPSPYGGYHGDYRAKWAPDVPTYLPHAILATIFCCLPFGIAAIIYAARVSTLVAAGDLEGAGNASDKARAWCWYSFGTGLAVTLLWFALRLVASTMQPPH